jgi:hypothetical protein
MTDMRIDTPAEAPVEVPDISPLPSCAPDNPLEALSWLGDTVEEVAEGLRARGIKGIVGDGDRCPLANYLRVWWGEAWVAIGRWSRFDNSDSEGSCPDPCRLFEMKFDNSEFPDLISDNG